MCPIAYTAPTMTSMNANEIIPSWAIEKATLVPAAITPVAAAEPAPTNTRNAVPSASARSFCVVVGGAAMRFALGRGRGVSPPSARWGLTRNVFGIVERRFTKRKAAETAPSRGQIRFTRANPCAAARRRAEHPRSFLSARRPAYDSPVPAGDATRRRRAPRPRSEDRKSTRLNSSHSSISYAVFCLKKKKNIYFLLQSKKKKKKNTK